MATYEEQYEELAEAVADLNSTLGQVIADGSPTGGTTMASTDPYAQYSTGSINLNTTISNLGTSVTPSIGIQTFQSPSYFDQDLCPLGHVASDDDIEFITDGVIVSKCITCGKRMQVSRVVGGLSLLRVQHLLGKVMSMDGETEQLEEFNLGDVLADFAELTERLEVEERALRQARKLIGLAEQVLAAKVSDDS